MGWLLLSCHTSRQVPFCTSGSVVGTGECPRPTKLYVWAVIVFAGVNIAPFFSFLGNLTGGGVMAVVTLPTAHHAPHSPGAGEPRGWMAMKPWLIAGERLACTRQESTFCFFAGSSGRRIHGQRSFGFVVHLLALFEGGQKVVHCLTSHIAPILPKLSLSQQYFV